jgi:hypothetical protein
MAAPTSDELSNLLSQLRELRDIEHIRELHARFWDASDGDLASGPTHRYDAMAECFTEDGVWIIPPFGPEGQRFGGVEARGREAIRESFKTPHQTVPFAMHLGVLPIINLAGDAATGRWKLLALMTGASRRAMWSGAVHDAEYRRTDSGWLISKVTVTVAFNSPFDVGWAESRFSPLARHAKPEKR